MLVRACRSYQRWIILALFIFIAMAKQDFVENLNQIFILIGGGIAAAGILGLRSRKSKPDTY